MFGQGEMVYNKDILVYKGRIIMYQKGIKRLLAVVLSACGLLVLSPLLLLSALPSSWTHRGRSSSGRSG